MKTKSRTLLLTALIITIGCNNPSGNTNAQDNLKNVNYESYYNEQNDYQVDYPDFLIPQGEAENRDGQKFISEDGKQQFWVFIDHKMDVVTGNTLAINQAFSEDQEGKRIIEKQLYDNYYTLTWTEKEMINTSYTIHEYDSYFTMLFIYPKSSKKHFKPIIARVTESFNLGVFEGTEGPFVQFLHEFLNDCYWNKNFNSLLRDKDEVLAKYIDPKMDIIRYFSPGSTPKVYRRADGFGFDKYTDFSFTPRVVSAIDLSYISEDQLQCELDFSDEEGAKLFYHSMETLPDEVIVENEDFVMKPIRLPYADAEIMAIYLPDKFGNPVGFYFVKTPSGWKLAAVNDSFYSA